MNPRWTSGTRDASTPLCGISGPADGAAGSGARMPLTVADNYDAELRRLNDRFRAATGIRRTDCVLDIGCGAGQTSRDAARAAVAGKVLGVDISERLLERARERTAAEGLRNIT